MMRRLLYFGKAISTRAAPFPFSAESQPAIATSLLPLTGEVLRHARYLHSLFWPFWTSSHMVQRQHLEGLDIVFVALLIWLDRTVLVTVLLLARIHLLRLSSG